jgi:hypothetical protein
MVVSTPTLSVVSSYSNTSGTPVAFSANNANKQTTKYSTKSTNNQLHPGVKFVLQGAIKRRNIAYRNAKHIQSELGL